MIITHLQREVTGKFTIVMDPRNLDPLEPIKLNGLNLKYLEEEEQTPEICLLAVQDDGYALQYVKKQTPEICHEAIRTNPNALRFVREQTREMCLDAVRENGYTLQFVKEQTPEICHEALKELHIHFSMYPDQLEKFKKIIKVNL